MADNGAKSPDTLGEQVDLLDVVLKLWRGKLVIIGCVILSLLLAFAYIHFTKEKWTSTALITRPTATQVSQYSDAINSLSEENAPKVEDIQELFIDSFKSAYSALSQVVANKNGNSLTFETLVVDKFKGATPRPDSTQPIKMTYVGSSAADAQRSLVEYIQQANDETVARLKSDLAINLKAKSDELNTALATQESIAKSQKELRIAQIDHALAIAKQSNIKTRLTPALDADSSANMFMLGTDILETMVQEAKSQPLLFSEEYYSTQQKLQIISAIDANNININTFQYAMKPSLPAFRDSPKRKMIFLLAALVGALVGAGLVLAYDALQNYQLSKRENESH